MYVPKEEKKLPMHPKNKQTVFNVRKYAKEKEKHQRFFINYIPAHLPSDVLFSYTHQQDQKTTYSIEDYFYS